ncbi:MAG: PilZ domain-containing protein [Pyrinomonadaceae bacterium]
MTETIRTLATRIGGYFNSIRSARRHFRRVPLSVSLVGKTDTGSLCREKPLTGYTCDLSETGLSLVMPSIRIGGYYLTGDGCSLLIKLDLPGGEVQMQAVAQRYERIQENLETKYLIGARITEISNENRQRFVSYLQASAATLTSQPITV